MPKNTPRVCTLVLSLLLRELYIFDVELLNSIEKTSYALGSELWENNFKSLLSLVKEYTVAMRVGGKKKKWLINFSLSPQLGVCRVLLWLRGKGMVR